MQHVDLAIQAIHDLMIPDRDRRIAAVLARCAALDGPVPLLQEELGEMANASRKQVNAALGRFCARGWVTPGYRVIQVLDRSALEAFAHRPESE